MIVLKWVVTPTDLTYLTGQRVKYYSLQSGAVRLMELLVAKEPASGSYYADVHALHDFLHKYIGAAYQRRHNTIDDIKRYFERLVTHVFDSLSGVEWRKQQTQNKRPTPGKEKGAGAKMA